MLGTLETDEMCLALLDSHQPLEVRGGMFCLECTMFPIDSCVEGLIPDDGAIWGGDEN